MDIRHLRLFYRLKSVSNSQILEFDLPLSLPFVSRLINLASSKKYILVSSLEIGFTNLVDKLEHRDILVVTKLHCLGRDCIDVTSTVNNLADLGIKVYCLALGGADLTSSAGQLTMSVISAVAQFERDLLIERTQSGLQRAKALNNKQEDQVNQLLEQGISVSAIARQVGVSRQTIMRLRDR